MAVEKRSKSTSQRRERGISAEERATQGRGDGGEDGSASSAFAPASELDGAVGVANAEIDLYTKKRSIPVEITALRSRSDYLITVGEELEPGSYAFHTQGTLTPRDQEAFSKVPENLRVAFPVQLR